MLMEYLVKIQLPFHISKYVVSVSYSTGANIFKTGIKLAVELRESTQPLVLGIGKDNEVARSVFSNKHGLIIRVAEFGNFVVSPD